MLPADFFLAIMFQMFDIYYPGPPEKIFSAFHVFGGIESIRIQKNIFIRSFTAAHSSDVRFCILLITIYCGNISSMAQ